MSRVARTMIIGIAVSVAVLAVAVALIYASIMGSLSDLFEGDRPHESDPEVVAAREQASQELGTDADRLVVAAVLPALGGSARIGAGEIRRPCDVGQHNWKIQDDFDLSCDLARLEVVTVPVQDLFRRSMLDLDAALRADGWQPDGDFGLERVMVDYWDEYGGTATGMRGYSPDNLPTAEYAKVVDGERRTLAVDWAEADSQSIDITYLEHWSKLRTMDGRGVTAELLIGSIPAGGYAVVVTESVEYFRE